MKTDARIETAALEELSSLREAIRKGGDLPQHIAIIMDGNGRWARKREMPRIFGHQSGRKPVRECVEGAIELGLPILTLYTFSIENWLRPKPEVNALMKFFRDTLLEERDELRENGVRMGVIGRIGDLPEDVRDVLAETMAYLSGGKKLLLNLALSYGGRTEIVDAVRRIAESSLRREIAPETIDENVVARNLYTVDLPDPDLLIRTSGEMRISNFLLWQLAYAEIWVTDVLWPDFRKAHLYRAVLDYQKRERRFGRTD